MLAVHSWLSCAFSQKESQHHNHKHKQATVGKAYVRTLRGGVVAGLGLRLMICGSDWFLLVRNWFRLVFGSRTAQTNNLNQFRANKNQSESKIPNLRPKPAAPPPRRVLTHALPATVMLWKGLDSPGKLRLRTKNNFVASPAAAIRHIEAMLIAARTHPAAAQLLYITQYGNASGKEIGLPGRISTGF
jgi:hypothetical protein